MARAGDAIEHPITGERITFLETARDTAGERLKMDFRILPGGFAAAAHIHPYQEERMEVRSGVARFRLEGTAGTRVGWPGCASAHPRSAPTSGHSLVS